MKFACVEYTTKQRKIWRHSAARPNYLCDPDTEIDPTSFGCYTSALAGEHIPLSGLLYGSLERPPSRWQQARVDLARRFGSLVIGHWSFRRYDMSYLRQFDTLLVIYQQSNNQKLVQFIERARRELPETILVTCSSPPFGRLREGWKDHPSALRRYRAFLAASHFNMNVCRATVPWYRLFSPVPSLYLPQPYPVEYALSVVQNREGRVTGDATGGPPARPSSEPRRGGASDAAGGGSLSRQDPSRARPVLYVAGDTVRPDILTGHLVAKDLQRRHPELLIRVTKTPEFPLNTALLDGTDYEVVPFLPWQEQLRELARVRLVLNTDLWWTRGRVPVDCAAAGVPCVGTTSDAAAELWPDLYAGDSTEIDRLLTLAERALTDDTFRSTVVEKARRRLPHYSYARTVERLTAAVALARAGRLTAWRDPVWEGDSLVLPAQRPHP